MIKLQIVLPEKVFFDQAVYMAVLPGYKGEIGVLDRHETLLLQLLSGTLKIFDKNMEIVQQFEISNGVADINGNSCVVLVDSVK